MGTSTDAYLMYGYDLGGPDEWEIQEVGEYDSWEPGWLKGDELAESVTEKLRIAVGFTETDWQADGYFERQRAADEMIGVEVVSHCSADFPMYVLAAHKIRASRGNPEVLGLEGMIRPERIAQMNARLKSALEVLDFRPVQEQPAWILASDWG